MSQRKRSIPFSAFGAVICILLAGCADRDGYGLPTQASPVVDAAFARNASSAYFRIADDRPRLDTSRRSHSTRHAKRSDPKQSMKTKAAHDQAATETHPPAAAEVPPTRQAAVPAAALAPPQPRLESGREATLPPSNDFLLGYASKLLRSGEVTRARRLLSALDQGLEGKALLELARSYDFNFLRKLPRHDAIADMELARRYYEEAIKLGAHDGAEELLRLLEPQSQALRP